MFTFAHFSPLAQLSLVVLALGATACQDAGPAPSGPCATRATVRDLTGLDGCGKVLELPGGQRLQPVGPLWDGFSSTPGQRVYFSSAPFEGAGTCMVGELVIITCIRAADADGN